ncbi:MAG: hypothetical protein QMD86_02470 [Patescibacteria group bacterium]|nr:hypothetical protein [Patescibacteria group bacterium]
MNIAELSKWISVLFPYAVFFLVLAFYSQKINKGKRNFVYKILICATGVIFAVQGVLKTVIQYYDWRKSDLSKFLLPPYQPIEYFISYSFKHFWLNYILAIIAAFIFYSIMKFFEKKNTRLFNEGEIELGTLMPLILGWNYFLVFIPVCFAVFLIVSIIKKIIFKENYSTISLPIILAGIIILIWGNRIIALLNLSVLKI